MEPMPADLQRVRKPNELGDFLRTRRASLTPEDAGITTWGPRRVPGLRREELAQLAGISVNYYTRLEQGQSTNASDAIIEALARALNLDDAERAHLLTLAHPVATKRRRGARTEMPTAGATALVASMSSVPVLLLGRRNDVLAWNPLGHALLAGHLDLSAPERPETRPNQMRLLFLDPHIRELYRNWDEEAALAVASLRYTAAQYPDDRLLAELIGDLSINSPEFARLWAKHDVRLCSSGTKRLHHPEVGDLDLHYEVLHLPDSHGQRLLTHTPAVGTGSGDALSLLHRRLPSST
ncbi:Transcriptional regulator, contains XRE-family HTH domain [Actinopolymorpha cephalotaxi]|uniref:Transcriptional regulator, contains XRE-family HTH domain n=2 Tax=Actinopolymorpha cephalotaxi TaxID=504797 RepID=A0A1I2X0B2_9ACTN|nr:Transcriptional regulator, contains XRE-family HTH domain [Actinopolymorpha cephalotaxi]